MREGLAEAAAQVPASEVIGKGDYFRFSIRDSLALEASFVQVCSICLILDLKMESADNCL